MAPCKAKTIEPEPVGIEGENVRVEETRVVERGETSSTTNKLDLILTQLAGVSPTITRLDNRLNTLEQRRDPPRSHTSSYYRRNAPIGAVSEAFLGDARRASLGVLGVVPPRARTPDSPQAPIRPRNTRRIIHPQLTNETHGEPIHVGERARRESERLTPEEIRRAFQEIRQNHERQRQHEPYQHPRSHMRHHDNGFNHSMTLGDYEEDLDREIEEINDQRRGQHPADFHHGRRGQTQEAPRLPMPKMDFPKFNGKRPKEWVYKAVQYFICQEINEQHKIRLAKMYLEEDAMEWYCFWEEDFPNATWEVFREELLLRFGDTTYVNHEIELRNLKQTSTVKDYQTKFERLSSMVRNRPVESKIAHFIGGLSEDIQIEMLRDPPTELRKCFALAKVIEEQFKRRDAQKKIHKPGFVSKPNANIVSTAPPPQKKIEKRPSFHNNVPVKYISRQEREERMKKGLCYYCDEKFQPGHKCKHFQFYEVLEDEDELEGKDEGDMRGTKVVEGEEETEVLEENLIHPRPIPSPNSRCRCNLGNPVDEAIKKDFVRLGKHAFPKDGGGEVILEAIKTSSDPKPSLQIQIIDQPAPWLKPMVQDVIEELDQNRLRFPATRAWGQARSEEGGVDTSLPRTRTPHVGTSAEGARIHSEANNSSFEFCAKQVGAASEAEENVREVKFGSLSTASTSESGIIHCEVKSLTKAENNERRPSRERVGNHCEAKEASRVEDLDTPGLEEEGPSTPCLEEEDPNPLSSDEEDLGAMDLDDGGLGLERSDPRVEKKAQREERGWRSGRHPAGSNQQPKSRLSILVSAGSKASRLPTTFYIKREVKTRKKETNRTRKERESRNRKSRISEEKVENQRCSEACPGRFPGSFGACYSLLESSRCQVRRGKFSGRSEVCTSVKSAAEVCCFRHRRSGTAAAGPPLAEAITFDSGGVFGQDICRWMRIEILYNILKNHGDPSPFDQRTSVCNFCPPEVLIARFHGAGLNSDRNSGLFRRAPARSECWVISFNTDLVL
ncbi:hypothetical protein EJ110_NYTH56371 [Nymphaea thermarum]|nr:hypothetical protein EJ110_NYTH56371 [Nymphaea thermarum]